METILLVEDRASLAEMLTQVLRLAGYSLIVAKDGSEGIAVLHQEKIDLVVTDLKLPRKNGMEVLQAAKEKNAMMPVIMMTAYGNIETAVQAVKAGAYDFIAKPFEPDHLLLQINRALERQRLLTENLILKGEGRLPKIIGKSHAMVRVMEQVQKVASGNTTVLIQGESGTGKDLFAQSIHLLSPRRDKPFVPINCAAIPHELLESELFGHERGAFTGAIGQKAGRFELADKGTLFLDEIGDMDLSLQAKLLRVLEDGALMRVGGVNTVKINVRVVAATHRNISQMIQEKAFREDLFYRLSVFPLLIPPLRERTEDIPAIVDHFLDRYSKEMNKGSKVMSQEAISLLVRHPWIGNIRELQNCVERAVILSDGVTILPEHLGIMSRGEPAILLEDIPLEGTLQAVSEAASSHIETKMIRKILKQTGGNKTRAAEILQVSYKTLLTKIKLYGIERLEPMLPEN